MRRLLGQDIQQQHFSQQDYRTFGTRLQKSLDVLRELMAQPGFGQDALSVGAEMEAYIAPYSCCLAESL